MPQKLLFREKALEKLSSPENIHELVQVTSARSWLALVALACILFTFLVWSIIGKIPKTVVGQGILIQAGGIIEINTLGAGLVKKIYIKEGDFVKRNDTIAVIAQPEIEIQVNYLQKKLVNLQEKRLKFIQNNIENNTYKKLLIEKYRLEQEVNRTEHIQKTLQEIVEREMYDLKNNNLINQKMIDAKVHLTKIDKFNAQLDSTLVLINQKLLKINSPEEAQIEGFDNEINEVQRNFDEINTKFVLSSYVKSQYEGKIIEIMAKQGQFLETGSPLINLELANQKNAGLQAVVYVPADEGKKITKKMKAKIAPSTIKVEEYGYIEGEVLEVSEYPSTKQGMMRLLSNADLVQSFSKGDPPIAITVKLYPNPQTFSQYQWTSKAGPPNKIQSGTLCQANIVVYQQRPITLIFPFLKENINL